MKKKILIFLVIALCFIIFFMRNGIIYELQLWSERIYLDCYAIDKETMNGCMNKYYHDLTINSGVTVAMNDAKEHYNIFPNLRYNCHPITHVIGRAAAEGTDTLGTLFAQGDPFCWSGYYHGVVEGKLRNERIVDITPEHVNNFCRDIPKTEANYFHYFNCVHGTGHAFMYVSKNDLPRALTNCEAFIDDDDKQNCAAGAFMENITASQDAHGTQFIKADEPYFPCTILGNTPFQETCYTTQATLIWQNATHPNKAFQLCEQIPDARAQHFCFEGLGREIAAANTNTVAGTIKGCGIASSPQIFNTCIVGAMKNFIAYYHDDVLAKALCASVDIHTRVTCDTERTVFIGLFASSTSITK